MKKRIFTLLCVLVTCLSSSSAMNDGDTFWDGNLKYTILSEAKKTVRLEYPDRDNITSLTINTASYRGVKYDVVSLAAHAFENCKYLRTVTFDRELDAIADYAFAGCTSLTSIELSSKVIGKYAFAGCTSLDYVSMYRVENIDDYAFYKCTGLRRYDVYHTLTRIGKYAFAEDRSIEGNISFPSGLASIGEGAYQNCSCIRGVALRNTMITKIEPYTFSNCPGIGLLTIPDNVTEIGEYAFNQNHFLSTIELPRNLRVIGDGAFGDSDYSSITIPASVDSIGSTAFCNCSRLSNLTFLGNAIKYIGGYAFNYTNLSSIVLPTGIKYAGPVLVPGTCKVYAKTENNKIPEAAYKDCRGLEHITIPAATTEIGKEAFSGCKDLYSVTFEGDNVKYIRAQAFSGCEGLRSMSLPSVLSSMGTSVFEGCKYLSSVTFKGNKLTTIPSKTFKGCAYLKSIVIPSGITTINMHAFEDCSRLKTVTINGQNLKTISSYAFCNTTSLTSINLPASLESIMSNAFNGSACRKDTCGAVYFDKYMYSVDKSDFSRWITVLESTKIIGPNAFKNLTNNLTRVTIPASVENICDNAFKDCEVLQEVIIKPNSLLKSIGNSAFENCPNMTMTLPSGVTNIGKYAFANCALFEVKSIPAGMSEVPEGAFMGCKIAASNADFKIPSNITRIYKKAFAGSTGARILSVNANCTNIDVSSFEGWGQYLDSIYVAPDNSRYGYPEQYNAIIDNVSKAIILTCKNCMGIPDGITRIGDYAFAGRTFSEFDIPSSVTYIGSHAFEGCKNLTTVRFLGNSVSNIGGYAFAGCPKLKNMSIPSKLYDCEEGVFMGCESLDVSIPGNIGVICKKAFMGSGLKQLVVPSSVYEVGDSAFCDCKQLQSVRFNGFGVDHGMGRYIFAGCTALKEAYLPRYEQMIDEGMFAYCRNLTKVEYENVTEIRDWAFRNCSSLNDIDFRYIRYVGKYSFQNCRALQSLDLSDDFTYLAPAAFSGCSSLQTVALPSSIGFIGKFAFENCTSLSQVNIPENMTKIPNGMFRGCSSLTNVELPSGTQRIGDNAFMDCKNLTSVTVNNDAPLTIGRYAFNGCESLNGIPANVATIADYAFAGCDGMTSMTLKATVDSIGSCAFADCTALKTITNRKSSPITISPSVFKGITQSNVTLYVPSLAAYNSYKRADVWKNFTVKQEKLMYVVTNGRIFNLDEEKVGEIPDYELLKRATNFKLESVTSVEELQNCLDKDVIIYNLKGQKVSDVVPGQIYIINGQKIYIKK